jgi:hypothetical protein
MGLDSNLLGVGGKLMDIDRDGFGDLFVYAPMGDKVFCNRNGASFVEITPPAGGGSNPNTKNNKTLWRKSYKSIPAAALLPKTEDVGYHTNGVFMQCYPTGGSASFYAPLELPDGSYITKITLEAYCNGNSEFQSYVKASLTRYYYNSYGTMASVDTSNVPPPFGDARVSSEIIYLVDNSEYSYGFSIYLNDYSYHYAKYYKIIVEYYFPDKI